MTSSPKTQFWFEIENLESQIPEGKLEYLRERFRNDLFDFVLRKFLEQRERRGLTQAELARRLSCDPARLNRLLGAPGNWTLSTVSDLLVGISGEALIPQAVRVPGKTVRNMSARDLLNCNSVIGVQESDSSAINSSSLATIESEFIR